MKLLFLYILVILTSTGYTQEKFIEVTVSDTVLAETSSFVYKVAMTSYAFDRMPDTGSGKDYEMMVDHLLNIARVHFDSLLAVIRQKGYAVLPLSLQDSFSINEHGMKLYSRSIFTHSLDSISRLYQLLRDEKNITAFAVQYADESLYQKVLYKKLIAAATLKAKIIASYSGRQLGKILSVEEKPIEKSTGWTSYPPLSGLDNSVIPGWHTTIYPPELTSTVNNFIPVANTLTIRFAIE